MIKQEFLAQLGIKCEVMLVFQGHNGVGNIYISNFISAMQQNLLKKNRIKSILTVSKGCKLEHNNSTIQDYLYLPLEDKKNFDIVHYFPKCFDFIDRCCQRTHVLVHCRAGVSRSATVICAYLMYKYSLDLCQAYQIVRRAHPKIKPNSGFISQLQTYNQQLSHQSLHYNPTQNKFTPIPIPTIPTDSTSILHTSPTNSPNQQQQQQQKQQSQCLKLCKQLQKLQLQQQQISKHIKKIKNMIEHNNRQHRHMSEFLRERICQVRGKVLCLQ